MMDDTDFLPVLLGTGLGAYNIARSLHEAFGVRSLALGRAPLRETANSRIIDVEIPKDFTTEEGVLNALAAVAKRHEGRKLLLIPLIEFYSNVVIRHAEQLRPHYLFSQVSADTANLVMNKADFYATCDRLDVPHPATAIITPEHVRDTDLGENLDFPYPIILKPSNTDIYPRIRFNGKRKVYLLDTPDEVRTIARRLADAGYDDDVILQEYLAGDEAVMRVANTYSDRDGVMRFCSVGQIVLAEYNPLMVGNYNAVATVDDPSLVASIRKLLDGIGYVGPANADVMLDRRTGTAKILEINLRPGAAAFYAHAGGGDLARYFVDDCVLGRDLDDMVTTRRGLWLNVPYAVARRFAPRSTQALLRQTRKNAVNTLKYAPDLSLKRRLTIAKLDARRTMAYVKYAKNRLNS